MLLFLLPEISLELNWSPICHLWSYHFLRLLLVSISMFYSFTTISTCYKQSTQVDGDYGLGLPNPMSYHLWCFFLVHKIFQLKQWQRNYMLFMRTPPSPFVFTRECLNGFSTAARLLK